MYSVNFIAYIIYIVYVVIISNYKCKWQIYLNIINALFQCSGRISVKIKMIWTPVGVVYDFVHLSMLVWN